MTKGKTPDKDFVWTDSAKDAFDNVKQAVKELGWIRPIDYDSKDPVYLAVDLSQIAVGWELGQEHNGK